MPSSPYTLKKLTEVKDSAPDFGLDTVQEARFANAELETEGTGVSYHRVKPNCRSAFGHRHEQAEEVYVVLAGSGRIKLDDEIVDLAPLDAIRIAPQVMRALEAGDDGLEIVAFGARHEGDGEMDPTFWPNP